MPSLLSRQSSFAKPNYDRWLSIPGAMAIQLCLGQAYSLGALYHRAAGPGAVEQSWIDSHINSVFTLAMLMLGLSAAFAGRITAAIGPRAATILSALLFSTGLAISAVAVHFEIVWLLYLGYGVIAGCGMGIGYIAPMQMLIDWFPDRRGLATGLAITGFGAGAMLATALSSALIGIFHSGSSSGVAETLVALAVIYGIIMLAASTTMRVPAKVVASAVPSLDAHEAVRTRPFYLLWALLCINVVAGINLLVSAPGVLTQAMGRDATTAEISGFIALLSISNMAGRFLIAIASDYLGRKNAMTLLLMVGCLLHAGIPLIASRLNLPFTVLEYMSMIAIYGGIFAILPAYVADVFGPAFMGKIHGRLLSAWSVGALLSFGAVMLLQQPFMAGVTQQGMRVEGFYATAILFLCGFILNFLIRPAIAQTERPAEPPREAAGGIDRALKDSPRLLRAWLAVGIPLLAGIAWTLDQASALPLAWQIGGTLLPLLLGAAICVVFFNLDRSRFAVRGVAGPYFAALALLFGLYASLMANEVWQKIARVNDLLDTEVSALQSLASIGNSVAPQDQRVAATVMAYAKVLTANDRMPPVAQGPMPGLQEPLRQLYAIGADADFFKGHAPQNSAFMSALETLRAAHLERSKLRSQTHDTAKLVSLLIFGLLTQIAIAFCHAGNQRAISTTVMLFSVGFSVSVACMELLDDAIRYADASGVIPYLGSQ